MNLEVTQKPRAKRVAIWLLAAIVLPFFCFAIFLGIRFFYGPVLVELRNGLDHTISINQISIKRCLDCNFEDLAEPQIFLASNQRGYISFNAKRGHLTFRLAISKKDDAPTVSTCEINVVHTVCESTAYIHNTSITCEPCVHY